MKINIEVDFSEFSEGYYGEQTLEQHIIENASNKLANDVYSFYKDSIANIIAERFIKEDIQDKVEEIIVKKTEKMKFDDIAKKVTKRDLVSIIKKQGNIKSMIQEEVTKQTLELLNNK